MKKIKLIILLFVASLLIISCQKKDKLVNDEDTIKFQNENLKNSIIKESTLKEGGLIRSPL